MMKKIVQKISWFSLPMLYIVLISTVGCQSQQRIFPIEIREKCPEIQEGIQFDEKGELIVLETGSVVYTMALSGEKKLPVVTENMLGVSVSPSGKFLAWFLGDFISDNSQISGIKLLELKSKQSQYIEMPEMYRLYRFGGWLDDEQIIFWPVVSSEEQGFNMWPIMDPTKSLGTVILYDIVQRNWQEVSPDFGQLLWPSFITPPPQIWYYPFEYGPTLEDVFFFTDRDGMKYVLWDSVRHKQLWYEVVSSPSFVVPDWSHDGKHIAFADGDGNLVILDKTGSERKYNLLQSGYRLSDGLLLWSPDDKSITFTIDGIENQNVQKLGIMSLSTNSMDVYCYDIDNYIVWSPSIIPVVIWSPDSRYLAINISGDSGNLLVILDSYQGTLTRISNENEIPLGWFNP